MPFQVLGTGEGFGTAIKYALIWANVSWLSSSLGDYLFTATAFPFQWRRFPGFSHRRGIALSSGFAWESPMKFRMPRFGKMQLSRDAKDGSHRDIPERPMQAMVDYTTLIGE